MGFGSNWRDLANNQPETEITDEDDGRWLGSPLPEPPEPPIFDSIPEDYSWEQEELKEALEVVIARGEKGNELLSIFTKNNSDLHFSRLDAWSMEETQTVIDWDEAQRLIEEHAMIVSDEGAVLLQKSLEQPEIQAKQTAQNKEGAVAETSVFIDFSQMTIERYGVTETNCYTVHPEQDLLEEIYRRLCQVDITFEEIDPEKLSQMEKNGDIVLSVETAEDNFQTPEEVDLRVTNLDDGQSASVPLTKEELENAVAAIQTLEAKSQDKTAEKSIGKETIEITD